MLKVFSTFLSLQGESSFQGKPCFFIRLAGCSLNCSYCDSRAACESDGDEMSVFEAIDRAIEGKSRIVEVTGGEPLLQEDVYQLLSILADSFPFVLLETCGAYSVERVDPRVHVVMDVKCPGSGMVDTFFQDNLRILENRPHELKFVISNRADFDWACGFVSENGLKNREIVVSPSFKDVSLNDLSEWVLEGPHSFRMQMQLHKFIWPEGEKEK